MKLHEIFEALPPSIRHIFDGIAAVITVSALVESLPTIATLLSIGWLGCNFYDRYKYGPMQKRKATRK